MSIRGRIQGRFREDSGKIQETREGGFREHQRGRIQTTFREQSGNIQGTIKGTSREESGRNQEGIREESGRNQGT